MVGFKPDSLLGSKRVLLRNETVLFTPWKLFGFHLAPVTRIDLAFLAKDKSRVFQKQNFYSGFSLGIRARNENLIFNTVEARVFYFPNTIQGVSNLSIEFRTNIKIKYPTSLVTAPGTIYNP